MKAEAAANSQPAFVYRDRAEMERRFGRTAARPQLAFVYRDRAEMERRFESVRAGR
jgi:hypothetical protein